MPGINIRSEGSTEVPTAANQAPVIQSGVAPAPAVTSSTSHVPDETHNATRYFIGPMPETVATPQVRRHLKRVRTWLREDGERSSGFGESSGDDDEGGVRRELLRRWRESGWDKSVQKEDSKLSRHVWIGSSFEIRSSRDSEPMSDLRRSAPTPSHDAHPSATDAEETFVTAPSSSRPENHSRDPSPAQNNHVTPTGSTTRLIPSSSVGHPAATPYQSQSGERDSRANDVELPSPSLPLRSSFRSKLPTRPSFKGKARVVNFASPAPGTPASEVQPPAPPSEVLARSGDAIDTMSAGSAAQKARSDEIVRRGDVIMRDRMLVKMSHTPVEGLPPLYDEREATRRPECRDEEWAEFVVCWRRKRLELYEDYKTWGKERILGHKKIAFIVPLTRPQTTLSLFSPVDLTFCITSRPTPVGRSSSQRHVANGGTNVFVFKTKSRSRAIDWMWNLWRELDGEIPPTIDVYCPALATRVRLEIPDIDAIDGGPGYKSLTPARILELCTQSLKDIQSWESVMEDIIKQGGKLALCWRIGSFLDWIWLEQDVNGEKRDWAVLFGLVLKQAHVVSHLEVRLAQHLPTKVKLGNSGKLAEPQGIEGYLYRVRTASLSRTLVYLTTHDGNLFTLRPSHAYPPVPPAPSSRATAALNEEIRRGSDQILESQTYLDLRNILTVRRDTQVTISPPENLENANRKTESIFEHEGMEEPVEEPETESDGEDEGGEEALTKSADKQRLRMKRSFELVLRTGHVHRFEAYSRRIALEWIARLRSLISYWTCRHRVDARQEMDIVHLSTGKPRFEYPREATDEEAIPEVLPDMDAASSMLSVYWNWCTLDVCRPIVKAGKLFRKDGFRKPFVHAYHILIPGHLTHFHLTSPKPNLSYPPSKKTINLLDAYIYSGQLAVSTSPRGVVEGHGATSTPRRYQDGLETNDSAEDTTFIIRFRPHAVGWREHLAGDLTTPKLSGPEVPPLDGKRRYIIFKARSKLERDAWCWALNCEIERITRAFRDRERNVRESGGLIP